MLANPYAQNNCLDMPMIIFALLFVTISNNKVWIRDLVSEDLANPTICLFSAISWCLSDWRVEGTFQLINIFQCYWYLGVSEHKITAPTIKYDIIENKQGN